MNDFTETAWLCSHYLAPAPDAHARQQDLAAWFWLANPGLRCWHNWA